MACTLCGHDDHQGNPCGTCAQAGGTCWQPVLVTGGDGDRAAAGTVEMATGFEERPCVMCVSFEKDNTKLIRHLIARGLKMEPDGSFVTPIAQDIPGRKSLRIDPRSFGYCRRATMPVDMLASCEDWAPVRTREQLLSKIRS